MVRRWTLLIGVAFVVLLVDQGTKYLAVDRLTRLFEARRAHDASARFAAFIYERHIERFGDPPLEVIPGVFHLDYLENAGAAWGLLSGVDDEVRIPFFIAVSVLALAFLLTLYLRAGPDRRLLRLSLAMIVGGAAGNLTGRLLRGYVIDFVDWHWKHAFHWPTFNVADVAISLGILGLLVSSLQARRRRRAARAEATRCESGLPLDAHAREDGAFPQPPVAGSEDGGA